MILTFGMVFVNFLSLWNRLSRVQPTLSYPKPVLTDSILSSGLRQFPKISHKTCLFQNTNKENRSVTPCTKLSPNARTRLIPPQLQPRPNQRPRQLPRPTSGTRINMKLWCGLSNYLCGHSEFDRRLHDVSAHWHGYTPAWGGFSSRPGGYQPI